MVSTNTAQPSFLFRFRPLNRLLDDGELENQEIYFSSPSDLNDPVEGYLDVFWRGDVVVWQNLFKNYLLCLYHNWMLVQVSGNISPVTGRDIPVEMSKSDSPTPLFVRKIEKIWAEFFNNERIAKLVASLGNCVREVRRDELMYYLRIVHSRALDVIKSLENAAPQLTDASVEAKIDLILDHLLHKSALTTDPSVERTQRTAMDAAFTLGRHVENQLTLIEHNNGASDIWSKNRFFLIFDFHRQYIEQLERLVYPEWYTACFVEEISNAALWGHYGGSHKGVCLKFRTSPMGPNAIGLPLNCVTGFSTKRGSDKIEKLRGVKLLPFEKVRYGNSYPAIDFFRSLGRLSTPKLIESWYSDSDGKFSECANDMLHEEDAWRTQYWKAFHQSKTSKLNDWEHEKEHRIVLTSMLSDLSDSKDRILKYNFSDLAGIIFGIRTPLAEKLRILEIVKKKTATTAAGLFSFYQAEYSHRNGKIEVYELPLLNKNLRS